MEILDQVICKEGYRTLNAMIIFKQNGPYQILRNGSFVWSSITSIHAFEWKR